MELKSFIKNTITSIEESLEELNNDTNKGRKYILKNERGNWSWWILFDLSVYTEESSSWEWWWKINVLWNTIWWELREWSINKNESKISFSINPHHQYKAPWFIN